MFGFLKNKPLTAYFKNGLLYKVSPKISDLSKNLDAIYNVRYVVVNGKKYDLENVKSIESIEPIKFDRFPNSPLGVTGNLVYIMRMKASNLKKNNRIDEAFALLLRATELMPISEVLWTRDDYMRYAKWLESAGMKKEAEKARQCVNDLLGIDEKSSIAPDIQYGQSLRKEVDKINLDNAKKLGTDIVEASFFFNCCDECTKYRGRYYSISGKDKRFPKKPVIKGCTCPGLDFSPVFYGVSRPTVETYLHKKVDIIKYSNRPFVVERTEYERETAKKMKAIEEKEKQVNEAYAPFKEKLELHRKKHSEQYEWICINLPDIAPKSLGGYTRMKNSGSKNFEKLVLAAREKGLDISFSDDDRKELAQLIDLEKQYQKVQMDFYFKKRHL